MKKNGAENFSAPFLYIKDAEPVEASKKNLYYPL